jgi:hypothetical protein
MMTKSIPLTQGKFALVDDEDYEYLNQWKWCCQSQEFIDYAIRCIYGEIGHTTIRMHRVILHAKQGQIIDHINHNGLDNRKLNLRFCTCSQNNINRIRQNNNTSGFRGIFRAWRKTKPRWGAHLQLNGKIKHAGYYDSPEEAARAYDLIAKTYFGEYAVLNYPEVNE